MATICILGAGYVGLVSAVCLADQGNDVTCVDISQEKIEMLKKGVADFYEPGLPALLTKNLEAGRLSFTTDLVKGVRTSDIIMIAVGTPSDTDGGADLTQVLGAAASIGASLNDRKIVVVKSTVPPGTCRKVDRILQETKTIQAPHYVVSNPEFLREGTAIHDTMHMERAVIGADSPYAAEVIARLHDPFTRQILITSLETSELTKYAANGFLATKISFINEMARLCEYYQGDIKALAKGMGMDHRIGKEFLRAGIGFGGSCFPKDTRALVKIGEEAGLDMKIIQSTIAVNERQRQFVFHKLRQRLPDLRGKRIAIMGLAFKPGTDDLRDAPALSLIRRLVGEQASVCVYDPLCLEKAKEILGTQVEYVSNPYQAFLNSQAAIITTEWKEILNLDYRKVVKLMESPLVIDARNCLDSQAMEKLGFLYEGIGIPTIKKEAEGNNELPLPLRLA